MNTAGKKTAPKNTFAMNAARDCRIPVFQYK